MHAIHQTHTRTRPRIIIVGAGISGLVLASFLNDLDADTLLLEQGDFRRKDHFPGVFSESDLRAIGIADRELAGVRIATVERSDHGRSVATTTSHAVQWRSLPHGDVLRQIRSSLASGSVEVVDDYLVTELLLQDGAVVGVRTADGRADIKADLVVLADESDPRLAEPLGMRPDWLPTQLAHLGKTRIEVDAAWIDSAFGPEGSRKVQSVRLAASWGAVGLGVVLPEASAVTVLAAMTLEDEMIHSRHIREFLDEVLVLPEVSALYPGPIGEDFVTEVVPTGGYRQPMVPATDGLMLVGDLVGLTNPLLRDGLSHNLGVCAAAAITIQEAIAQSRFNARQLASYRNRLQHEVIAPEAQVTRGDLSLGLEWAMTAKPELASYLGGVTKRPISATLQSGTATDGVMRRIRGLGRRPLSPRDRRRAPDD